MLELVTILEYLNEDCWNLVLDYVPVQDIIRSERISKRWQEVVLKYLSRSHTGIGIEHAFLGKEHHRNILIRLKETDFHSLDRWTSKLGASVVSFHCQTEEALDIIQKNCPNIEALMLIHVPRVSTQPIYANFKHLQKVTFYYCKFLNRSSTFHMRDTDEDRHTSDLIRVPFFPVEVTDACVGPFLVSTLEELKLLATENVTGECLNNLQSSKLKSLVLKRCSGLRLAPLLSAVDRLKGLTKFVLKRCVAHEIINNINMILDKMPQLEYLHVLVNEAVSSNVFYESVCRMGRLKYLSTNYIVKDEQIEAVTRSCKNLRTLHFDHSECVTGRGMRAISCNLGEHLTTLGLRRARWLKRDDVVDCVRGCPNLTSLVLFGWSVRVLNLRQYTANLLARLANDLREQRSRPILHVHIEDTEAQPVFEGVLKIHSAEPSYDSDCVHEPDPYRGSY